MRFLLCSLTRWAPSKPPIERDSSADCEVEVSAFRSRLCDHEAGAVSLDPFGSLLTPAPVAWPAGAQHAAGFPGGDDAAVLGTRFSATVGRIGAVQAPVREGSAGS